MPVFPAPSDESATVAGLSESSPQLVVQFVKDAREQLFNPHGAWGCAGEYGCATTFTFNEVRIGLKRTFEPGSLPMHVEADKAAGLPICPNCGVGGWDVVHPLTSRVSSGTEPESDS